MKYQLRVWRKDGSASGRVITIAWPINLKGVRRITLSRYKAPKAVDR